MDERLARHGPVLLLLAPLALLPFGSASELPVLVAALLGVVALARGRVDRRAPSFALATGLFLTYWLPELASAPDAVDAPRAWREVAVDLRFLPFLWFALVALRPPGAASLALRGVAIIAAAFAADALVQALTGFSLGGPNASDRLSGIFGDDNLKLGPVLSVLAPVVGLVSWQRGGTRGALLAFALLLPVVLLAGSRAGWVGFAVATLAVLVHRLGARRALALSLAGAVAALLLAALAYPLSARFAERVDRTAAALSGERAGIDHALAGRLAIWDAAAAMGADHPVNGVGVRGFRVAYPAYAPADDRWVGEGGTALHAHQLLLELWSETGAIGIACWGLAALALLRLWRRAEVGARRALAPPAIALLVMVFPLNTHLAFYSSFWALLLFTLLALLLGTLSQLEGRAR